MSDSLRGARVALLEARMESEIASLVRRHGGEPIGVPAMREVERPCEDEVARAVEAASRPGAVVVLATGVGLTRSFAVAEAMGRADGLRRALAASTLVARGPKPVAALKREGLAAQVRVGPPHTTRELVAALEGIDVRGRDVVYVHDGGGARTVPDAIAARGGAVVEVRPYEWGPPSDTKPLGDLVRAAIAGEIEALAVTTQAQAKYLFEAADAMGSGDAFRASLRDRVVVAAVGPTTARALEERGVAPHVVPKPSTMGALVAALARHLVSRAAL